MKVSICSRVWTTRRTATIACSGRPSAARSISAWKPRTHPGPPQGAHALQRGGRRDAHALGQAVVRDARVLAQRLEDRAVDVVESQVVRHARHRRTSGRSIGEICADLTKDLRRPWQPRRTECFTEAHGTRRPAPATDIRDSILDAIGDTPLVRLSRIGAGLMPQVVAKVESLNPGGSIKDRAAIAMIEAAERDGLLRPGGTIVEPTSGNTGTGLAMAARLKGYRVIAVMPDKMSKEKIDLLRAYGAEVVVCPTNVAPDSPESYYSVSDRLAAEIPGAFKPNQYFNPANPEAHYRSTGPGDLGADRRADHAPRRRRRHGRHDQRHRALPQGAQPGHPGHRRRPRRLDLLGASDDEVKRYLVEGVGEDFWPATFDPSIVDRWVAGLRQGLVPDHAPPGDGGGHPRRRLVRHRGARGARGRARASTTPTRWSSSSCPTAGAPTCPRSSTTRG